MAVYSGIQKEETFKAAVFRDFFSNSKYAYEPNIDNIDFIVTEAKTLKDNIWTRHYLWAESKKGIAEIYDMLTQLVLTSKKTYEKGKHLPPPYIACFDTAKIAFVPFHDILPIFTDNDINWTITPSDYKTEDFQKTKKKVEKLSKKNIVVFDFDTDKKEIIDFINNNLVAGNITSKFQINKNNFVIIYNKWYDTVRKSINIDWEALKKAGILDGDFFLADLLSKDNHSLKEDLLVVLMSKQYKFDKKLTERGSFLYEEVGFRDNQKVHKAFWDKYERPPLAEYWDYIINRRDLLVPQDIRERKGSFFTPRQWVELSQKYIADALGEDWQDEYYIWDCAAGTGNLLAGLVNKNNIWASTLDKADVDVMKDRIKNGANLLEGNVFQFDFLNDDFSKLPKSLQSVIKSDAKRKKLIIYINPPYAEHGSTITKKHKAGVSMGNKILEKYENSFGSSSRELYAQFIIRIYKEISGCKIGMFSKLKHLQANNFKQFRLGFKAKFVKGFIVPANTFDNVKGNFPIAFQVWNTEQKSKNKRIKVDVYDKDGNYLYKKLILNTDDVPAITKWIKKYEKKSEHSNEDLIGLLNGGRTDFQNQNLVFLVNYKHPIPDLAGYYYVYKENLLQTCIYISVRKCIKADWTNDRDQFLEPDESCLKDKEFIGNCLIYTLFHDCNNIQSKYGTNHWIPFKPTDVNAKGAFESSFMYDFINGDLNDTQNNEFNFSGNNNPKIKKLKYSKEAKNVFNAGKELWKYYHSQPGAKINASFYDIREAFQGRDNTGKMNSASDDDTYNSLIKKLRQNLYVLAEKIEPKVYEYGFLIN